MTIRLGLWLFLLGALSSSAPAFDGITSDTLNSNAPPFSFKYNGKASIEFLASWQKNEEPATPSEGGQTRHYVYTDPATKLKVRVDVRSFTDFAAVDWVLHFTNGGTADTPIIEDIQPLDCTLTCQSPTPIVHANVGSMAQPIDFEPQDKPLGPGATDSMISFDTSSVQRLPYFNLQDGDHGIIGAIGWTGSWHADFVRDKVAPTVHATAGMLKTHFLLHPGETVRTPRIVLLNWKGGDLQASQNLLRRLILAHYSPTEPSGKIVALPLSYGSWGTELISAKLATIKMLHDRKIPIDCYWVDAGWYGTLAPKAGQTLDTDSNWMSQVGTWTPSPVCYPNGLKPLGDALKADGYGFILWMSAESGSPGSALFKQHPDWFVQLNSNGGAVLDLGKPEARQGITGIASQVMRDAGATFYRQDFTYRLNDLWAKLDPPDRVGISEINYITGFYQFWDDLRAQNPGLQIDNCAGGARRMDIEAMSRSVALWRSDALVNSTDPNVLQTQSQGLDPWVPLNAGIYSGFRPTIPKNDSSVVYTARSGYSAGYTFGGDHLSADYFKPMSEEFHEVRPYFYGDFYSLTPYHRIKETDCTVAWQLDRPDLKSGVVQAFRREKCAATVIPLTLHAIDPAARYDVEIRAGFEKGATKPMSGQDLAALKLTIPTAPGSVLVFYRKE